MKFSKNLLLGLILTLPMSMVQADTLHYRYVDVDYIPPLLATTYQKSQDITISFVVATSHGPVYGSWTGAMGGGYAYAIIAISNGAVHWDPFLTIAELPNTFLWESPGGGSETVMINTKYSLKYGQENHGPWVLTYD